MLRLSGTITIDRLLDLAGKLCSEDKENSEYDRGLAELIVDAAGLPTYQAGTILEEIYNRRPDCVKRKD